MTASTWRAATNLVVIDLEGSGAQDRDAEAILEIAAVRLVDGRPDLTRAYSTLINPQRSIQRGPWISPGLTDQALAFAPTLVQVQPGLAARLTGAYLVGHNVGVDWRLLHRRCPDIEVAGLIDTLHLARQLPRPGKVGLTALLDEYQLTATVNAAVPGGRPHRALWDTVAAAILLDELVRRRWKDEPTFAELLAAATPGSTIAGARTPPSLFDILPRPPATETGWAP